MSIILNNFLCPVKTTINYVFINKEPWQIVSITTSSVLLSIWLWELYCAEESLLSMGKKKLFRLVRKIPYVANRLEKEKSKITEMFKEEKEKEIKNTSFRTYLPIKALSRSEIMESLQKYLDLGGFEWEKGFISGAIYCENKELKDLVGEVFKLTSYTNPLHPDVFPGICLMEAEIIKMVADLFHGTANACGSITSGGTESIVMACKAYRDYGEATKGIQKPVVLLPTTAHPAFDKAASYFKIYAKHIKVDPVSFKVDIRAMEKAITKNTVMLVGSAPNFPYGTMDDIVAIGALGLKYNIPVHVDCCLGGFLAIFMSKAGYQIEPFNFLVPGVTSISADTHKYGFTPKGSSIIMYAHPKYRHHQYFVTSNWPGGTYGSPSLNGSRTGGLIAATWATLLYFGIDGYVAKTRKIIETTKYLEKRLREMDEVFIFGTPVTSVIAIGSNKFHIYRLVDGLKNRGWCLNTLQFPSGFHLCVTDLHTEPGVADRFISDIKEELIHIKETPDEKLHGMMAMYGVTHTIPDRTIVEDFARIYLDFLTFLPQQKVQQNGIEDKPKDENS